MAGSLTEPLLSTGEVSRLLGVPVATLYQWRYREEGPASYRVGGRVRYIRTEVEAWLEGQRKGQKAS
jgi:excisionase family DNA binding protein